MHFNRVHIEVTNICGLACSFCPPKLQPTKTMNLEFFDKILMQLQTYTKELAFHMMGDPLTLSNLKDYLDLAYEKGFRVELTTSGYYLKRTPYGSMFHPTVKQLNISLNAYNKNDLNLSFDDYMNAVLQTCRQKVENYPKPFINLRLWNLDESCSETEFNALLFDRLSAHFNIKLNLSEVYKTRPKSIRLDAKVLLHFDSYFEWPSLNSTHESHATCYGLKSHIGILANGTVVPCRKST
jgi:organic radical activating enzyme